MHFCALLLSFCIFPFIEVVNTILKASITDEQRYTCLKVSNMFVVKHYLSRLLSIELATWRFDSHMTGRDLQRISGNSTSKVGHLSMKEVRLL